MANLFIQFPELAKRRASSFEYLRASSLTSDLITRFFEVLAEAYTICNTLSAKEIHPRCIWAMDETGINLTDLGGFKVVARKGSRSIPLVSSNMSDHITVIYTCNSQGYSLEPCFILKKRTAVNSFLENCKKAGFHNPLVMFTEKAFINFETFNQWAKSFVENAKFNSHDALTLIYDGHTTHTMHYESLKYLNQEKVISICIPAHSSHLFNVSDVAIFSKMKDSLKRRQLEYKRTKNRNLTLNDFPYIFKQAWDDSVNQNSIIAGIIIQ